MKFGLSKVDFTPEVMNITMMGYGLTIHKIKGFATRLYARAFYIEDKLGNCLCLVVCELGVITVSVKHSVLKLLQNSELSSKIGDNNLLLMAQHTHSGPGGYSYHPFYNVSTPGFQPKVLEAFSKGIYQAIKLAYENATTGNVSFGKHEVPEDRKVSFNRALEAYNANEDTKTTKFTDRHLAVDRMMRMLTFSKKKKVVGLLNWFAVHTTSMPSTENNVHFDNKGYAAQFMEKQLGKDSVAGFAQGCSGDVSPNHIFDPKKKEGRLYNGASDNHDENAQFNGNIQYEEAGEILKEEDRNHKLNGKVDAFTLWVDMSDIDISPVFADGKENCFTAKSCIGVPMFAGSQSDGIGMPAEIVPVAISFSRAIRKYELTILGKVSNKKTKRAIDRKYAANGVKDIFMETGVNRLIGTRDIKNLVLPGFLDDTIELMKHFHKKGAFDVLAMTPQELPYQILAIDTLLILTYPFELTTTAGKRLKEFAESKIDNKKYKEVLIVPYANGFNGYITTPEEYQLQLYEGGHTVFGQWSLYALIQITDQLLAEFEKDASKRYSNSSVLSKYDNLDLEKLMY